MNAAAGPGADRSDDDLVAAARGGDGRALELLLRRHHDRIVAVCRQLCRDRSDAEDAAQEAMIAIVRRLDRFDGRSRFSTWAYRVATNSCLDELRRRRRRPVPIDGDHAPEPPAAGPGPAELAVRAGDRAELAAALDRLPEDFRTPLVLRDVADLDYATIGEILDLPPGTVRSRIARGRARLAEALAQVAPADGNPDGGRVVGTTQDPTAPAADPAGDGGPTEPSPPTSTTTP
ncbi:RNA polymerase sigma factor [Dermatobacter hominis]|uniref:RNA polymerase sigma factor n=1 Tax=Dermatobacter hominis TaxID=2884263 RepID=UPI001D11649C|nr:sigma-70 family RNA polymerase sigma factor [Dermatobacter hominis]UDY34357.1 sigma-70 family RNA polymerase sigma factor [Dermatobacter hominis]